MAKVKMEQECSRCARTITTAVGSYEEAARLEKEAAARQQGAQKIADLFAQLIKDDAMPDVVGYSVKDDTVVILPSVCDPVDAKRSCVRRTAVLIEELRELPERAPRKKKSEDVAIDVE